MDVIPYGRHLLEDDDMYVTQPNHPWWQVENWATAKPLADGYRYTSDANPQWLSVESLRSLVEHLA
jgi:UDP-N-acetylglucosamine 4,6-dehydratase